MEGRRGTGPSWSIPNRGLKLEGVGGPAPAEAPAGGAGGAYRRRCGSSDVGRWGRSPYEGVAVKDDRTRRGGPMGGGEARYPPRIGTNRGAGRRQAEKE